MANKRQNRKTGKFIKNIVKVDDARAYAADYYDKHQKSIDKLLNGKTKRNNKDVFIDLVDDLFDQNRSKYGSKKNLKEGIRGIINELQGIDPRLNEIKRTAENREEAGFKDLRKLNKRVSPQEIYYVGVHKWNYTFSCSAPANVYEYRTRINAGLIQNEQQE